MLKQAGLVVDEAIGTRRIYRLDPNGIDALRGYFTRFWTTAMSSFRDRAEAAARAQSIETSSGTTIFEEQS